MMMIILLLLTLLLLLLLLMVRGHKQVGRIDKALVYCGGRGHCRCRCRCRRMVAGPQIVQATVCVVDVS